MFRALLLESSPDGPVPVVRTLSEDALVNEGDLLLDVLFSSLNYKDGLAVTNQGKIIRAAYPFIPGIDLVGRVVTSQAAEYEAGDLVIGTGWGLGEDHWGGYTQRQRVQADWMVPLPDDLTPQEAMAIGTAGFTAMLSVMTLEEHGLRPEAGEVVVTGASGGVGSMSVALLAALGYTVVASTGKTESHAYLSSLGAARMIAREVLGQGPGRPMDRGRWAGAVDSVGAATLAALISQMNRHASIAACGLAGGHRLETTVFPFILRGVNLLGIDSNTCPKGRRLTAWNRLAHTLSSEALQRMMQVIPLEQVPAMSAAITKGAVQGRVVVDVNA